MKPETPSVRTVMILNRVAKIRRIFFNSEKGPEHYTCRSECSVI